MMSVHLFPSHRTQHRGRYAARRGQSLVEFTLTLPVLLLIIAAVLEVGNVLTLYNRTQTAAREGARFGGMGGSDADILTIVEQASRQSLQMNPAQTSVWVIRPTIDTPADTESWMGLSWNWEGATATNLWGTEVKHLYGDFATLPVTATEVLNSVKQAGTGTAQQSIDGTEFVVVVVRYDGDTILNLPFFQAPGVHTVGEEGRVPMWAFAAFVQTVETQNVNFRNAGCSSYSLAIERDNLAGLQEGDRVTLDLNQPFTGGPYDQFGFTGWRAWNEQNGEPHTNPHWVHNVGNPVGSLWYPGTSLSDTLGFLEYQSDDPDPDTDMHRGDWVLANEDSVPGANQPLGDHRDSGRAIRVIVYDYEPSTGPGTGNPGPYQHLYGHNPALAGTPGPQLWMYRIDDFAIVKIRDFNESAQTVTFEFIRFDDSCGFEPPPTP